MRASGTIALKRALRRRAGTGWASVLVFHRVSTTHPEGGMAIRPARFRLLLALLRDEYTVISASDLVARLQTHTPFSGREVVITFDDGYEDNCTQAAPLLREFHLPACFFLTAGYIGTPRTFPWDEAAGRSSGMMSWEQARSMVAMGFEIGLHTWSHPDLGREPISSWTRELVDARRLAEERLDCQVRHFAYPFGGREHMRPDWVEAVRRAGLESNFCGFGGHVTAADNPYWIPRMGASHQRTLTDLRIDMDQAW